MEQAAEAEAATAEAALRQAQARERESRMPVLRLLPVAAAAVL